MSGRHISIVYFYLVSIIALILLVIGIYNAVNFVVNSTQYEKYPLRWGGYDNCEFFPGAPYPAETKMASPSAEDLQKQKEDCIKRNEMDRRQHRVDDIKNALTFTLIGALLFGLHFPIALRRSRDTK